MALRFGLSSCRAGVQNFIQHQSKSVLAKHSSSSLACSTLLRGSLQTPRYFSIQQQETEPTKEEETKSTEEEQDEAKKKPFNLNRYDPKMIFSKQMEIEERLAVAEREPYGAERGRAAIWKLLEAENYQGQQLHFDGSRKISKVDVRKELNRLVYTRHALRHGALGLRELFEAGVIARSFDLDPQMEKRVPYGTAKGILRQLWRSGKSASLKELQKRWERRQLKEKERKEREKKGKNSK